MSEQQISPAMAARAAVFAAGDKRTWERLPLIGATMTLIGAALLAVKWSWGWPIGQDAPMMQYCAFLIDHGKVPYRDIIDVNSIGSYFFSWLEIHLFGFSNLGWRIFDLLFLGLGAWGIAMIARPFGKWAIALGSSLFVVYHVQAGPLELGQRDFMLAVLALVGCGLVCRAMRGGSAALLFVGGIFFGVGSTIKPVGVLFGVALFGLATAFNFPRRRWSWTVLLAIPAGALIPWLVVLFYLHHGGALGAFWDLSANVVPLYAETRRVGLPALWNWGLGNAETLVAPVLVSGLFLLGEFPANAGFELLTVGCGAACGVASYVIQAKGFWYHLDPLAAFLCVWCGMGMAVLLASGKPILRLPAIASMAAFLALAAYPQHSRTRRDYFLIPKPETLEDEITQLRSAGKDHGIQVMDQAEGGIHALYDLKLVQATGFIYDFYFYRHPEYPFVQGLRRRFLAEMQAQRPDLIVVVLASWPDPRVGLRRINTWPEFRDFLQSNYSSRKGKGGWYEIYVRND